MGLLKYITCIMLLLAPIHVTLYQFYSITSIVLLTKTKL